MSRRPILSIRTAAALVCTSVACRTYRVNAQQTTQSHTVSACAAAAPRQAHGLAVRWHCSTCAHTHGPAHSLSLSHTHARSHCTRTDTRTQAAFIGLGIAFRCIPRPAAVQLEDLCRMDLARAPLCADRILPAVSGMGPSGMDGAQWNGAQWDGAKVGWGQVGWG